MPAIAPGDSPLDPEDPAMLPEAEGGSFSPVFPLPFTVVLDPLEPVVEEDEALPACEPLAFVPESELEPFSGELPPLPSEEPVDTLTTPGGPASSEELPDCPPGPLDEVGAPPPLPASEPPLLATPVLPPVCALPVAAPAWAPSRATGI